MKRAQRKARNGDTRDPLFNQSVEKALAILEVFGGDRRAMNLAEIATAARSGPCGASFSYSLLANVRDASGNWHDHYAWIFHTGKPVASCTLSFYIPPSAHATSTAFYWLSTGKTVGGTPLYSEDNRLDRMEARSGGDYHAYNSFEAVSRKLGEIERSTNERARRKDGRAWLVSGMLIVTAFVGLGVVLSGSV